MTWAPCPHGVRTRGKKKSHPRTEETRFDEGESASGRAGFLVCGVCLGWWVFAVLGRFSRMRSEGFSFNSWGSGGRALFATRCFYVRNRWQPSAVER